MLKIVLSIDFRNESRGNNNKTAVCMEKSIALKNSSGKIIIKSNMCRHMCVCVCISYIDGGVTQSKVQIENYSSLHYP